MKSETIIEVVEKLVGSIEPYGDTTIDNVRKENQENLIDLTYVNIETLVQNAKYKDRSEHSIQLIGESAYEALKGLKELIDEVIED